MTLFLDTSVLIDIESRRKTTLEKLEELTQRDGSRAATALIVWFEFVLGIQNKSIKNKKKSLEIIQALYCYSATDETATIAAELKHKYDNKGVILSLSDLLIAAQVIQHKATLVTKDRDFEKVEELKTAII